MNKLKKNIRAKHKAREIKIPEMEIPVYGSGGNAPVKQRRIPIKLICFLCILMALAAALYLPELLYVPDQRENQPVLPVNLEAVKLTNEYTRDCPEEDFDGDGLVNYLEQQHGTSPRRIDTDGDGVSDYAELYLTQSNPNVYDEGLLEKQVELLLEEENKSYTDPYVLEGVVLWADDLFSRAFGSVVRTQNGYRILNFDGWAEFPDEIYAYEIKDGEYRLLDYKADSNAWRIYGDTDLYLSKEPIAFTHELRFASWEWGLPDNTLGKVLSFLLPDHAGLLTCLPKAEVTEDRSTVTVDIQVPSYDQESRLRYGSNHNSLKELGEIYSLIDSGFCVLASLNSSSTGETLVIVYGYTPDGHLLAADPSTLEPAGVLTISPCAASVLENNGILKQIQYFDFYGLGFDSAAYDRIHFISASVE